MTRRLKKEKGKCKEKEIKRGEMKKGTKTSEGIYVKEIKKMKNNCEKKVNAIKKEKIND